MKTYVFPGQGSQAIGMGGDLFDRFPELVNSADKILGYSIKELCLEDPRGELHDTRFTQPALYIVNALSYYAKVEDTGVRPDFVAGHSLGEFNALLAANCYDFEPGLKIVKKRGELMSRADEGGMAAILNMPIDEIERTLKENDLQNIDIANLNTFSQTVISGSRDEIARAEPIFQKEPVRFYPLSTSGAFHSRFMKPLQNDFSSYLKKFKLRSPELPVISNVTAQPYMDDELVDNMAMQMTNGVRWCDSVLYLLRYAAERGEDMDIEEVGFGEVLTRIIYTIKQETSEQIDAICRGAPTSESNEKDAETSGSNVESPSETAADVTFADFSSVDERILVWNEKFPVGSRFRSTTLQYDVLESRTEAMNLFGHRAAVYMQGYNGYFDIDELQPA